MALGWVRTPVGCGLLVLLMSTIASCQDPKDPQTWIKKIKARKEVGKAIKELRKIGDPVAIPPLCELYKQEAGQATATVVLQAIIDYNDRKAIPCLIEALDFTENSYSEAAMSSIALAKLKATESVPAIVKVLSKPLPVKSRANKAKVAAIRALAMIGDKRAVQPLINVADGRPEKQDFFLNKQAVIALGELGDPAAVPVLIRALFMSSTLQGIAFPMAQVALVRLGKPAVAPLVRALQGKDEELAVMAKDLSFKKGVILQKTALVLGQLRASSAVPVLLAQLAKADTTKATFSGIDGVIEALGRIGDKRGVAPLVKLLLDDKANYKLRMQACSALTLLADKRAVAPLLRIAEKGYIQGGWWNLREAGAMAYARIVGSSAPNGVKVFKAIIADKEIQAYKQTKATFQEALDRTVVAVECKDDAKCYGAKVVDRKLSLAKREKAGIMIGVVPNGREALASLVEALPNREPILRKFFLETAKKIGIQTDKQLLAMLEKLAAKDSKRKVKFLGADLASDDKIAIAVIGRKEKPSDRL